MTCRVRSHNHKQVVGLESQTFNSVPSLSSAIVSFTTADELLPNKQLFKSMNDNIQQPMNDPFDDFCFDNSQILGPSCISRAAYTSNFPESVTKQRESSVNHQHCSSQSSYESRRTDRSSAQTTTTSRSSRHSQHFHTTHKPVSTAARNSIDFVSMNGQQTNSKVDNTLLKPESNWSFAGDKPTEHTAVEIPEKRNPNQETVAKKTTPNSLPISDHKQLPTNNSFSSISPSVRNSSPEVTKFLENLRKKQNAARELFFTERQFAQDMAVVVRIYMCGSAGIGLSMRQIDTLFSNVTHVLDLSLSIVATLETQIPAQILQNDVSLGPLDIEADKELLVGKAMCLVLNGQFYQVYEAYIHNNPVQMSLCYHLTKDLAKLQSGKAKSGDLAQVDRQELATWLQRSNQRAEKFTTAWSLDSLLIKPIQRLGKYPLLLKTMLQYTDPSHEDYKYLQKALKRSIQYLDCVNARFGVV